MSAIVNIAALQKAADIGICVNGVDMSDVVAELSILRDLVGSPDCMMCEYFYSPACNVCPYRSWRDDRSPNRHSSPWR